MASDSHTSTVERCEDAMQKGCVKASSRSRCCRYFVIIFHLLHKAIVGCCGDESRILSLSARDWATHLGHGEHKCLITMGANKAREWRGERKSALLLLTAWWINVLLKDAMEDFIHCHELATKDFIHCAGTYHNFFHNYVTSSLVLTALQQPTSMLFLLTSLFSAF